MRPTGTILGGLAAVIQHSEEGFNQPGDGRTSLFSSENMTIPSMVCLQLLMSVIAHARVLAVDRVGNSSAARMPIMAMTTSSSINVKARVEILLAGNSVSKLQ